MTAEALIDRTLHAGDESLADIGREFFAAEWDDQSINEYITGLLRSRAYERLAAVFSQGCISKQYKDRDYINKFTEMTLEQRYFDLFIDLCERTGVDPEEIYPMLAASFKSQGFLKSWSGAVKVYFLKCAYADYDKTASIIARYDEDFELFPILMRVDAERAENTLLEMLLYKKHINKTVIRRYLLANKIDIVPKIIGAYKGASVKTKEAVVRLLLIYKNDVRASAFLQELTANERSVTVRKLLERDKAERKKKTEKPGAKERFFDMMLSGERMSADEFGKLIATKEGNAVASTLFFDCRAESYTGIFIVDDKETHDLDNRKITVAGEVGVVHPAELGSKYAYLKHLKIEQCFNQIRREVYLPSKDEKTYNVCKRLCGTVIAEQDLKEGLRRNGFRLLNKNKAGMYAQAGLLKEGILCVLDFVPTDFKQPGKTVSAGDVRFYRYEDVIKLAGSLYTEGVRPCDVGALPERLFSEFLYGVYTLLRCK